MTRLVGTPRTRLIRQRDFFVDDDEDERRDGEPKAKHALGDVDVVFVCDLDRRSMAAGPDYGVWFQAAGAVPVVDGEFLLDSSWISRVASRCAAAIFLSSRPEALFDACSKTVEVAKAGRRPFPQLFVGPFYDDADDANLDRFAGIADGVVIEPRPRGDADLEAEMLRRAASCLGERLVVGRGSWAAAPATCLHAEAAVLALVAPSVCEFVLLDEPPPEKAVPGGNLVVCADSMDKPWWAPDYVAIGPDVLRYRAWMVDPR